MKKHTLYSAIALALSFSIIPNIASAQTSRGVPDIRLKWPLTCSLGEDCLIQNYFDHNLGSGAEDYTCGNLTFDRNQATDIRLRNQAAMNSGVNVLAAAMGQVITVDKVAPPAVNQYDPNGIDTYYDPDMMDPAMRDMMMDDLDYNDPNNLNGIDTADNEPPEPPHEEGNMIVIDHGNGWQTQYDHLMTGSIIVEEGQLVQAGYVLGKLGNSGTTEMPNLEFIVRHRGRAIDPFTGTSTNSNCNSTETHPLWARDIGQDLTYRPTEILQIGFSGNPPQQNAAQRGDYPDHIRRSTRRIILWAETMGVKANDEQHFQIFDPNGVLIHDYRGTINNDNAVWFGYSGIEPRGDNFRSGQYRGHFELLRNGEIIDSKEMIYRLD